MSSMSFLELPEIINDSRQIIHVDMDAFYASVEEREHPQYRQKALVIAPDPRQHNGHGVITTANYRARQYGVGSAMPAIKAVELIPFSELLFTSPNFTLYRQVSNQIHQIFTQVTDTWEPVALDEAYLDVTANKLHLNDPIQIALIIQRTIKRHLHLTCSVGISYNKFLAKMASDYAKPFGRTVVTSAQARNFLAPLPISKFHGIGHATQEKLNRLGLQIGRDLQQTSFDFLTRKFGKTGFMIYQRARGIDNEPVKAQRQSKSIGREQTFNRPVFNDQQAQKIFQKMAQQVAKNLQQKHLIGQTVVIKVRTVEFVTYTRRRTLAQATSDADVIFQTSQELFALLNLQTQPLRLIGVTMTNLREQSFEEIELF
ncbi:DNA polymerase IV [Bombilactobacillus bombi]|nr:DNA polymerase IV [Bombilactobacillus bombi]